MKPRLKSIKLLSVDANSSIVAVVYACEAKLDGIELMGVDSGLDWVPNESISMEYKGEEDDLHLYYLKLEIVTSCEFRARGYIGDTDFWAAEMNHLIERDENGGIELITDDLTMEYVEFNNRIPVNYDISLEEATKHVENVLMIQPDLFQLLVDTSIWIGDLLISPEDNKKIVFLSDLIRYMKTVLSEFNSKLVDDLVRPVYLALTRIYILIISFDSEDSRVLSGSIEKAGYIDLFNNLSDKVKQVESSNFGNDEDQYLLFKEHLKFI